MNIVVADRRVTGKIQLTPFFFIAIINLTENCMSKKFKKTDSKGREELWEWEETPEVTKAVARLHETIRKLEEEQSDYGVGK
jgi:hypothetical protein